MRIQQSQPSTEPKDAKETNEIPLEHMRLSYEEGALLEDAAPAAPLPLLAAWLADAAAASSSHAEPNAVALATAAAGGRPSCRIVLAKHVDSRGLVFFTNYESRKARDLDANPWAAATFWWGQRSVRIEGRVVRVAPDESDAYYAVRPLGSRIGAWASKQSSPIADRAELEASEALYKQKFADGVDPPRPPFWGGYRIVPDLFEFWQGRPSRLHDRLEYRRNLDLAALDDIAAHSAWTIRRLSP